MMIEFKIKTLDSNDHDFSVEDEITIEQLKEKVREQMGILPSNQRLIYCGRVLKDETKLSQYDLNGKVIHLVHNAPPSVRSSQNAQPAITAGNVTHQPPRRPMVPGIQPRMIVEAQNHFFNTQLDLILRMNKDIKLLLTKLTELIEGEIALDSTIGGGSFESLFESYPIPDTSGEVAEESDSDSSPEEAAETTPADRFATRRRRNSRPVHPHEVLRSLEELENLNRQFALYRSYYFQMLRDNGDVPIPEYSDRERLKAQRVVRLVSEITHSFSHAYHAASNLNLQVGRILTQPAFTSNINSRHMPLQAHVNILHANRRPQQGLNVPGNPSEPAANPAINNAVAASNEQTVPLTNNSAIASGGVVGGSTNNAGGENIRVSHPTTVNSTIAPPINVAALANLISAAANANNPGSSSMSTGESSAAGTTKTVDLCTIPGMSHASTQTTDQSASQAVTSADGTDLARSGPQPVTYHVEIETRVPIAVAVDSNAFSNIMNNPGGLLAGVQGAQIQGLRDEQRRQVLMGPDNELEMMMSLDDSVGVIGSGTNATEIRQGVQMPAGIAWSTAQIPTELRNSLPQQLSESVVVAPLPWGGAPTPDILHNIMASVIRQGLIPGLDAHLRGNAINLIGAGINAVDTQNNDGANQEQPNNNQENANRAGRMNVNLRRATTSIRAHPLPRDLQVYDRYLHCDSIYSIVRDHGRRSRDPNTRDFFSRPRLDRPLTLNLQTLVGYAPSITDSHVATMYRLLNRSNQSSETVINSTLIILARELFLAGPMRVTGAPSPRTPAEFQEVRIRLRTYIQDMLEADPIDGGNTYENIADQIVGSHSDFINRMNQLVSMHQEIDAYASLRKLIKSRIAAVIAAVLSDTAGDWFTARFYIVITKVFVDVCALIARFCIDDVRGVRVLFRTFMRELTETLPEDIQEYFVALGNDVLNSIINNCVPHVFGIHRYIIRRLRDNISDSPEEDNSQPSYPPWPTSGQFSDSSDSNSPSHSAPILAFLRNNLGGSLFDGDNAGPLTPNPATPARNPATTEVQTGTVTVNAMETQYVAVLEQDRQRQCDSPAAAPYSDAYLSGMPSRKRRCVRQVAPPVSLRDFVTESVREAGPVESSATESTPPPDNSELRAAFRGRIRALLQARSTTDEDYEGDRHRALARLIDSAGANIV